MTDKTHAFATPDDSDLELTSLAQPPNEDWCIKNSGERVLLDFGTYSYVVTVERRD